MMMVIQLSRVVAGHYLMATPVVRGPCALC